MSINKKINILSTSGLLILGIVFILIAVYSFNNESQKEIEQIRRMLMEERQNQLINLVSNAYSILETANFYEDAQKAISQMRFGNANQNCFFVIDTDAMVFVHPLNPDLIGKVKGDLTDEDGKKYIQEIINLAKEKESGFIEYREKKTDTGQVATKLAYIKLFKSWKWIVCTGFYIDDIEKIISEKQTMISSTLTSEILRFATLIALIMFAMIIISYFVSRRISIPIQRASAMLKNIAKGEGDLTKRLKIQSKDEIGELAQWFNIFIARLDGIIKDIAAHSNQLDSSSLKLSNISKTMSNSAESTFGKTHTVADAVTEMSASMNNVSGVMEQTSKNEKRISIACEEMTSNITGITKLTEKGLDISQQAVVQSKNALKTIQTLNKKTQDIDYISEVITKISEQIHLLSLNALIEANRSSQYSRGFAVVAHEVKNLSGQTSESVKEIKKQLLEIQSTSYSCVKEVGQISSVINEISSIVRETAGALDEQLRFTEDISLNVKSSSDSIHEVNENISQSSLTAKRIDKEIAQVNQIARELSLNSTEVNGNAENLSILANQLGEMVGQFKFTHEKQATIEKVIHTKKSPNWLIDELKGSLENIDMPQGAIAVSSES
ncbi:MAG: cache domain-containing protein [Desulfobacterales bacterium]|nr:cache domain-containing protein [Desulfobacterales bacterium]